ncbi:MAG: 4-(cytidine 5'-diphospho)-2-C-methyl-D-erythritol kinase [Devosia nanyangense]|uniref:4-diphosphocytidyl-2-C-methyl-D-erythritol kinase n=1 Tax=Devosia nanyangense TaxID=1228055 RepID=A0A933L3E2_9HYPH|nr:4-(cytidine 5'-diphospho)-2-C-methyl-D-erythritol kinase [Devosia nanyangense]
MDEPVIEAAPAKINLALHVTGRRADGYHSLEMLVAFAEVGDELEAAPARKDSLSITGPFAAALGNSEGNLVLRALAAFRARWPEALPDGLAITLRKNLPVAAGLGGGSADAAAALRLFATMSSEAIAFADLFALATTLGADVPMCLHSRPAEVRGIGEIVLPLKHFPACHVVLVNPLVPVVTAEAFRKLERRDNPGLPAIADPLMRPAQLGLWLGETRNDLEAPALAIAPIVGELIEHLAGVDGCILARMSGSGATVFGLFGSSNQAHQAAHDLRERWPDFWVAAAPLIGIS